MASQSFVMKQKQSDGSYNELIPLGYSHQNLISNSNFQINQRNVTSWQSGYGVDRWNGYNTGVVEKYGTYLFLHSNAGIFQITQASLLNSQSYTMSVEYIVGGVTKIISTSGTTPTSAPSTEVLLMSKQEGNLSIICNIKPNMQVVVYIINTTTTDVALVWSKLEIGECSTPYVPTNYGVELLECQRYYIPNVGSLCNGYASGSTSADIFIPTPIQMQSLPVATLVTGDNFLAGNGEIFPITSAKSISVSPNGVRVSLTLGATPSVSPISGTSLFTNINLSSDL